MIATFAQPRLAATSSRSAASNALAFLCALASIGCGNSRIDQALTDLSNPDAKVRRQAAQSLFELQPKQESVVTALTTSVSDSDPEVRRWICRTLGELGELAAPAIPALEGALSDPETPVRRSAAFALQKLSPDSQAYRDELRDAMLDGDGGVIVALPRLSPKPDWAIPTLLQLLSDHRPGTRRLAVEALGELSDGSAGVTSSLTAATKDKDDRVRESAVQALAKISSSGLQSAAPNGKL